MDIIDSFVVSLNLDARQYKDEIKNFRNDLKQTDREAAASSKALDAGARVAAQSMRGLRNEIVGLGLAFIGARSLVDFVGNIIGADAATGRFSANVGAATEKVNAWQEAIKTVNGSPQAMDASIQSLADTFQNAQLRGDYSKGFDLAGLGLTYKDLADPLEAMLKLAAASERMSKPEFRNRAMAIGINSDTINLLEQGRSSLEKLIAAKEHDAALTQKEADQAAALQGKLADLKTEIEGGARPAIYKLVDALLKTGDAGRIVTDVITVLVAAVRGIAVIPDLFATIGLKADLAYSQMRARLAGSANPEMQQYYLNRAAQDAHALVGIAERNDIRYGRTDGSTAPDKPRYSDSFRRAMGSPAAGSLGRGSDDSLFDRLIQQESGGRAGISGPMTQYGQAHGLTQMLDSTAEKMARKLGVAWKPELMRGTSAEAVAYQRALGRAYLDEGMAKYGGQVDKALMYYHGGPNERLWGKKTHAYAAAILGRSPRRGHAAAGAHSVSQTTSVGQITVVVPNGDADSIAKGVRGALAKHEMVVQANTGLQ